MSCVLFKYYVAIVVTIFVRFPIEIGCCSMTTSAMIDLMHQNPNYESDPCYIKWKAAQDADLAQLWARQDDLQKRAHDYNRRRMENEAIERANRQDSYSQTFNVAQTKRKESSIWKILGGLIGGIVGLCCCIACVTAVCDSDDATTTTTTNVTQSAPLQAQLTTVVSSDPLGPMYNANFSNLTESSSQEDTHANVPLMMPKRQNSLPSYEDAVKMPTAPPIE
ncbi:uncharacterized protein LOC119079118 isoform X2 [Bradysia coprophila]|uniref:uncharacterized protein LOC119079118 isoform X2 n=1 Tax=Bradysia coprophila TaxID=38358 RepID=UPI00187D9409|nr:uncharacterized protein LOC119079118 isoform X2 [Bradysia coprophila]